MVDRVEVVVDYKPFMQFLKFANLVGMEIRLHIEDNIMWFRATDAANVQMVYADVSCTANGELVMGFDPSWWLDKLSGLKSDTVSFRVSNGEVILDAGGAKISTKLIEPEMVRKDPKEPKLDFPAVYFVDGGEFYRAVALASKIGDYIEFVYDRGKVLVKSRNDIEKVEISLTAGEKISDEVYMTKINPEYLLPVAKIVRKMDLEIKQGTNIPLEIFAEGNDMAADVITAPIIGED